MRNKLLIVCLGFIFTSCHKKEIPIINHNTGDAMELQVAMGEDYRYQMFYHLESNEVISSNLKTDWDLAFESSDLGWHVTLNSSRGMAVHQSTLSFADITSDAGLSWDWDVQSGNLDSTAIGDWQANSYVYVIDMGYDVAGIHLGFKKIILTAVSPTTYSIGYGDILDVTPQTISVVKNTDNLFTYYKIDGSEVMIAPPNDDWDLEFTQYTHLFYNPLDAYVVTGVLLNRFSTSATHISTKLFSEVNYADVNALTFSTDLDYIGYDWKTYDYVNSVYVVNPTITYVVKTNEGYYYKLRFIDFYNEVGEKGYPKLEVQQL